MKHKFFPKPDTLVRPIYRKISGDESGIEVSAFLKNISYLSFGTAASVILSFIYNILSGRVLGPIIFGEFAIIQTVAMFLYIPMLLGYSTAMVKYNVENEDYSRQCIIISTSYGLVCICSFISLIVYYSLSFELLNIFSINHESLFLAILFAVSFSFYTLAVSTLSSLYEMKKYAIVQPVFGIVSLSSFLLLISFNYISLKTIVISSCLAYAVAGGLINIFFVVKYIRLKFDKCWAISLSKYSIYATVGAASFVIYTNIANILINKNLTVEDVGIYKAYYLSSINIIYLVSGIITANLFPYASKSKNQKDILNKINKIVPYLFIVGMPVLILCQYTILKLYGSDYPIDTPLMVLFGIASILILWYSLFAWTFVSSGTKGLKISILGTGIIAAVTTILGTYLIPSNGLFGAIEASAASFAVGICYQTLVKGKIDFE